MDTKIKGVSFCSVYDTKPFDGEINDQGSDTVTTGYIPIDEQVKMIMRGQITIGNMDAGFENSDDDIERESPEEYFEDATDYNTESELRQLYEIETSKSQLNTSEKIDDNQSSCENTANETNEASEA